MIITSGTVFLDGVVLLTSEPGPPSPSSVAKPVTLPVTLECVPFTGLENVLNNAAWYSLTLASTTTLIFDTEGSTGSPDTMLGVYDSTGSLLGYDDDSGTDYLSTLTLNDLAPGTYYIGVGYYYIDFGPSTWNAVGDSELFDDCTLKLNVTVVPPPPPPPNTAPLMFEVDSSLGGFGFEFTGNVNVLIDWGDGNTNQVTGNNPASPVHLYSSNGIYTANITGQANGFAISFAPVNKVLDWGDLVGFDTLANSLKFQNLTSVPNYLHPNVSNLSNTFHYGNTTDSNISLWDTSNVTDMSWTFYGSPFNQDIGNWNTSNVSNMLYMFNSANNFNQNIGGWDTSNVTNMNSMFAGTDVFNGNIGSWNVSNVTEMTSMFYYATNFNQDLSQWCVTNIVTKPVSFDTNTPAWVKPGRQPVWGSCPGISMILEYDPVLNTSIDQPNAGIAFYGAVNALINWGDGQVDTITNYAGQFYKYHDYGGNTSLKTISITGSAGEISFPYGSRLGYTKVVDWGNLGASYITLFGCKNLSNVPNVAPPTTNYYNLFYGCENFNDANVNLWDVSNVTNMSEMFQNATAFNRSLNSWNTSNVANMQNIFYNATSFNGDISSWDTSKVTDMSSMFGSASSFNQNIGNWNVSNVTDMTSVFNSASAFNQDIGAWNTGKVYSMASMFYDATAFNQSLNYWNTSNVTIMSYMFYNATSFNGNISLWNTSNVNQMSLMFSLTPFNQDISNWNTSNVSLMNGMFNSATSFNQDLSQWCVTNIVTKPATFDTNTPAWVKTGRQPVWGTCPP